MKTKKKLLALTLACTLCTVFGIISGSNLANVKANATPAIETHGSSVRLSDPTGVRFLSSVSAEYAEGYEIGTLIVPKNVLGDAVLNHNDDMADTVDIDYENILQTKWSNKAVAALDGFAYDENRYYFNAVLTEIPNSDYGTVLVARAYAVKNGVYIYGEQIERSIAQVAALGLQNGVESELLEEYVDIAIVDKTPTMAQQLYVGKGETVLQPTDTNGYAVTWSSSDEEVATVDKDGVLTAKVNGKTTITGKLGTNTFSSTVQVGNLLEGEKLVDFTAQNYAEKVTPGNSTSAYSKKHLYDGEGTLAVTGSMSWQLNLEVKGIDISKVTTLTVMVWQNTTGGRYFRVFTKNTLGEYTQLGDAKVVSKGQWSEVSFNVSQIKSSLLDVKFYFGASLDGSGDKGDTVYISDIYVFNRAYWYCDGNIIGNYCIIICISYYIKQ